MNRLLGFALAAIIARGQLACGQGTGDVGGETHWDKAWLTGCISNVGCPSGLSCIENLCTVGCTTDAECETLGSGGQCLDVGGDGGACAVPERLGCSAASTACTEDIEGWFCVSGGELGCALPIEICSEGVWQPAILDDCRDTVARSMFGASSSSVYETQWGDSPVALDILFVIDNSSSMTQEERGVAVAFEGFVAELEALLESRPRIAVTSVDNQCELGPTVPSAQGVFNTRTAVAYPPPAQLTLRAECREDADCDAHVCEALGWCTGQSGQWACRTSSNEQCIVNPNGSINTTCRRRCTTDDECREALGDPAFICQKPSADELDWGCLLPPPTDGCPVELPPILEGDDLQFARCLINIGVNQERCLKYEQGLEASRLALDPAGPNREQVAAFMRPEAILVVVYVSDEEDCSAVDPIDEESYDTCGLLGSSDEGGPLTPTRVYSDFLREVKAGGRVMTLALVGQSLATDPAARAADYAAFIASKGDPKVCYHQSSLCTSVNGSADWGKRYAEVAEAFGPDGHVENICAQEAGFDGPLRRLAGKIAANAKRVCLPEGIGAGFVVSVVRDDVSMLLEPGPGELGYALVEGAPECDSARAVAPNMRLRVGDRIRIHDD